MKRTLPPTYFLLALVATVLLHFLWPLRHYWGLPWSLVGTVPLAVGMSLSVLADREFKRYQTTVKPFEPSTALVTAFPFSVSRNPMYLGLTAMLLGVALLLGSVSALVPAVVFVVLMDRRFIRIEERMLAEQFGDEWSAYQRRGAPVALTIFPCCPSEVV
ncbi:MAG TPA: isoprenylcysteine carboxylmethyltransferase family protein [Gemmatimonadales bacterium]|nr:isoprenylcysteine carboxylmethyltransferase family protein [Gemmatimonadales bacterium]